VREHVCRIGAEPFPQVGVLGHEAFDGAVEDGADVDGVGEDDGLAAFDEAGDSGLRVGQVRSVTASPPARR
jgi:hypothetical protein